MVLGYSVEFLERDEAWGLLGNAEVGRVGTSVGDRPWILPVNYRAVVSSDVYPAVHQVFFRAVPWLADQIRANDRLVVEAGDNNDAGGWSVTAEGTGRILTSAREIDAFDRLPLRRWNPGEYARIELTVDYSVGFRFTFGS